MWNELVENIVPNFAVIGSFSAICFIIGLILGIFAKKLLKIIIIGTILIGFASWLGLIAIQWTYFVAIPGKAYSGIIYFGALLFSIVPLSVGLLIGLIFGFAKG